MGLSRVVACLSVLAIGAGSGLVATATPAVAATATYSQPGPVTIGQSAASAGGAAITINATAPATPYPSTASVADVVGSVTDVNVTLLGVTHATPDELDVMLVSPGGKRAIVMSDAGGATALAGTDLTLDDQAGQDLPDSTAITTGSYRPANYEAGDSFAAPAPDSSGAGFALSGFNDSGANGTWRLFVMSDGAATGSITGWRLDVKTTGTQPYPSTLTVAGAGNVVTDVNVVLNGLSHSSPADIDLLLVGPAGQQATILSDAGSDTDVAGLTLKLDDGAATQVPTPMVTGTYQPTNLSGADAFPTPAPAATGASALSAFNGTNPNGTWQLFVADDAAGDTGQLSGGWSLQITATDTIAPRVTSTVPTAGKKGVSRTANISATFSEKVRPATLSRDTVYLVRAGTSSKVRATLTYSSSLQRVTLNPANKLKSGTKYRMYLTTRIKDLAGNRLDQKAAPGRQPKTWTFTTR
jgi:subtilisin-like proprotein convertase family protein